MLTAHVTSAEPIDVGLLTLDPVLTGSWSPYHLYKSLYISLFESFSSLQCVHSTLTKDHYTQSPCPRERLTETPRLPRGKTSHSDDRRGYRRNHLHPKRSLNLKRQPPRRLTSNQKAKRGRTARKRTIQQKTEMLNPTRHRKPKEQETQSEMCEFLITVYFW